MSIKVPVQWNGMYLGNMSEAQAEILMQIRNEKIVPNLTNMIFDFPLELIEKGMSECRSIRSIAQEEQWDLSKYVGKMRDYQTVGTAFMYVSPRSMIADGVGTGKTVEISGLINYLKMRGELSRFLIAVETSAIGQTVVELTRFTGLNVIALPSEKPKMLKVINKTDWSKVDGVVIKHSALKSDAFSQWLSLNINSEGLSGIFNTFLLDESSVIKNAGTKTFEYTKNICNIVKRVHLMNATVFETNIIDIYNQMDMMNNILLPAKYKIENKFCTFGKSSYWTKENGKAKMNWRRERNGYKDQDEFKQSLKLVYFGRSLKDIGKELPHIYKVYQVTPTNDMCIAMEKGYRYTEVLNCPSLVKDINIKTNRESVPKIDRLCSIIENEFGSESVMVYCFHIDAQHAIAEELRAIGRKPVILNGKCTDEDRYEAQTGFNSGKYDVIITNIKKSLNLYGGDVCIIYSMETNIAKMEQIRGRIDRHIDDKIKTFIMLLYERTDEFEFFSTVVCKRAKDSRDLTIDAKTAADYFKEALENEEEE